MFIYFFSPKNIFLNKKAVYLYQNWYAIKFTDMEVLEVSTRQFRDKQKDYFELADMGKQILIRRGKKRAYFLSPVEESDFTVTSALLAKLDNIRQNVKEGKYTECKTAEESIKFLESL
ncbi:hypothetical protein FACS1894123_02960 [Bacteroidia bacterium]|nr:hypothetical protein FACS1894123_02960 [Bacteroidia bacterium]